MDDRKLVVLATRARALTVEELHRRAAGALGPLARWPGVRRVVQSLTRPGGYRQGAPVHDVVLECWFDDDDALDDDDARATDRPLLASPVLSQAPPTVLVTRDHVVTDGPVRGGLKSFELVTRRPGLPEVAFRRHWLEVHGPLAARIAPIRRYVQSHTLEIPEPGVRDWDGLAITWFDTLEDMRRSAGTAQYARVRADEANFVAGPLPVLLTTEEILVDRGTEAAD